MNMQKKPHVVVIGGGTGMPVLLRGLKHLPIRLTSLVNVADDGGSTGRLRQERTIPAPGDIRNVIAALSEAEPMLLDLFQYRFEVGNGLSGHSLGNMLLAALTEVTGDFSKGIQEIARVFNVKGEIYPISNDSLSLHAEMIDGTIISGESNIPLVKKKIKRVFLKPEPPKPLPHAVSAIENADLIVISPGSLYTSIMPNLIIPQISDVIKKAKGKIVYVCNVMTQVGETTGYSASNHVKAIYDHIGSGWIDAIIVHNKPIKKDVLTIYESENAHPVDCDIDKLEDLKLKIIEADIIDYDKKTVRHNAKKIAEILYSLLDDDSIKV